jgi:HAD superfamily hydrolase (TIGR01509 family)
VPGAAEVVQGIRAAGIDVCVASQGKLAKTRLTLGLTHLRGLFPDDALFSAESFRRGKPHPDLFLYAASGMEVSPGRTVVVEDTPSGIKAAVAADMRAIGYARDTPGERLKNAGAGATMKSLEELPEILGL